MGVTVPPPWDSILESSPSESSSESPASTVGTLLDPLASPSGGRTFTAGEDASSACPRVDVNMSLITALGITGKIEETAGNNDPEQDVTTAVVAEAATTDVVPG